MRAPVVWRHVPPASGRRAAQHRGGRSRRATWSASSARSPRPRRPGPTSAWCPSWRSPATRPRTCSSSPPSWPTTWPRSKRWRRATGSAPSWSATSGRPPTGTGSPTRPRSVPAAVWWGSTGSASCPTTACSTSSAGSCRAPRRRRSSGWPARGSGISVCEDVWFPDGPVAQQGRAGADVVVNLNASPYNRGRRSERLAMLRERVAEAGCAIAYVNQVGGQDELVFDGDSLIVAADGTLLATGAQFATDLVVVDIPVAGADGPPRGHGSCPGWSPPNPARRQRPAPLRLRPALRPAALRRGRGLCRPRAGDPRLPGQERVQRGGDRAVRRHRLVVGGDHRGRRPGPVPRPRDLHALALFERRFPSRRRGPGRAARHRPAGGAHRGGARGVHLHAGRGARAASPPG